MSKAKGVDIQTRRFEKSLFVSIVTICIICNLSALGATYYVATNGDNLASGAIDAPWGTISSAVNRVQGGDRIIVRGGTYREEAIITNTSGTADHYITVEAYPNEQPIMKGSIVITNWIHHSGNIWKHTSLGRKCQQVFADDHSLRMVGWPNEYTRTNVFSCGNYMYIPYGHTCYERNNDNTIPIDDYIADMTTNSFYYDEISQELYVWLPEGDDPANHLIEASYNFTILFIFPSADFIEFSGFTFKHSNSFSKFHTGYSAITLGGSGIMKSCTVENTDCCGVFLCNNARLEYCLIANNGMEGIGGPEATNIYIARNMIVSNNSRNFTYQWGCGMKLMPNAGGIIESNECAFNHGNGLWLDTCNTPDYKVIRNNYVHDNGFMYTYENYGVSAAMVGIAVEATLNAEVYNNLVEDNCTAGIYVSASANSRIYNNTIINSHDDTPSWHTGRDALRILNGYANLPNTNNWAYNNLIINNQTDYDIQLDAPSAFTSKNFSDYNCYFRDHSVAGYSGGSIRPDSTFVARFDDVIYTNLSDWTAATGYDSHSMVINPQILAHHAHLGSNSPCINAGLNMSWMTNVAAFDGHARILDGTVDIGAFEFMPIPDFIIEKIELSRDIIVHDEPIAELPQYGDPPPVVESGRDREARLSDSALYSDTPDIAPTYKDAIFSAYVTVKNQGSAAGDAGTVRVCLNQANPLDWGQDCNATQTVGLVNAGCQQVLTFENLPVSTNSGIKTFRALVDADQVTIEDCETNNQLAATYTVLDPAPFSFDSTIYTNHIVLNWTDPYLSGYSNSTIMVRWSTGRRPMGPDEGSLLYRGTNLTYTHTDLSPDQSYYYSFWVSQDGVNFVAPQEGSNTVYLRPFRRPVQVLMRSDDTFTAGSKVKTSLKMLFFGDNATAGTIDSQELPEPFSLATKWVIEGAGCFNPATNGDQVVLRNTDGSILYLLYFNYDGTLHWEDDTNALCWTSYNFERGYDQTWDIDGVGDINGDHQDELILRGNSSFIVNGKEKSFTKVLFYDDNSGRLASNQPYAFNLGTRWTIEGIGNFNTAPVSTTSGIAEELLLRHNTDGGFYLLYLDDNGALYWDYDNTNDISWTSWSPGSSFATNAADWQVSEVGDVNGDGQDEVLLKSGYTFQEGGKTKSWYRFLFYDATNGQIKTTPTSPFKLADNWNVEAMGNFNTTNTASCNTAEQVLLQHTTDHGFYLLYFDDNGNLYWDADDTNNICWTSWSPGASFATNASVWSVQAVGDFIGNR